MAFHRSPPFNVPVKVSSSFLGSTSSEVATLSTLSMLCNVSILSEVPTSFNTSVTTVQIRVYLRLSIVIYLHMYSNYLLIAGSLKFYALYLFKTKRMIQIELCHDLYTCWVSFFGDADLQKPLASIPQAMLGFELKYTYLLLSFRNAFFGPQCSSYSMGSLRSWHYIICRCPKK